MTSMINGLILIYLIAFVNAPWWLVIPLIAAIVTDVALSCYDMGRKK